MSKRCQEEFNPWPPFVDIFASVILVMLLFLLITIVNIGYYAQFKHKISYTASVETEAPVQPEEQTKATPTNVECVPSKNKDVPQEIQQYSFHKINTPKLENSKDSFFEGGKSAGNAVSYVQDKKEFTKQKVVKKDISLRVEFQDKEVFVNSNIKRKIKLFVSDINRRSKLAVFTIYSSNPDILISSTMAKQVALGRVLNVKNIIKKSNIDPKKIKMNLQKEIESGNEYGDIVIKVYIP